MRRSVGEARDGRRGPSTWESGAATRLGASISLARFSAEQPYEQGLEQFHEVFRPDERELVSMGKAFEMVRKVGDGLERHRQTEIEQRGEEPEEPVAVRETITQDDGGEYPMTPGRCRYVRTSR